ncbi:GntR family transcriptional regulator [Streptomyces sp. NA04227]|uniref:GntR family transcriptional regulator n=1 Tax=Streptomyces sp. NA04227 TaxID=2742136 RepID=UPI00158FCE02|nr:GntR family transcriptional regulator [Streptomyces sp. NA04227]QKW06989.1 GntR family transcriptional regulator [Streptomyces sp. NA04227]
MAQEEKAKYLQIAEEIIERIESGELTPGDHVPSVRDIIAAHQVGAATAGKVPGVLRQRGYAETVRGVGTVVRARRTVVPGSERLTRLQTNTSLGPDERVEILALRREPAEQEVADGLGIELGDQVGLRRRRYLDKAGVVTVSSTWVAGAVVDAAPAFLEPSPLPRMTFGLIEEATGRRVSRRRDTHDIRPAPADIAGHMGVDKGTLLLTVINHYWDQFGEPTEFAIDYVGPGRSLSTEYAVD